MDKKRENLAVNSVNHSVATLKKTVESISKVYAPILLLMGAIADFKKIMEFIFENSLISFILLFLFLIVFVYHLGSIIKENRNERKKRKLEQNPDIEELESQDINKKSSKRNIFSKIGLIALVPAIGIIICILGLSVNGLHYPIIETIPKSAVEETISALNSDLKDRGEKLRVRYYCNNGDCAIAPNGIHYSKEDAQKSINQAIRLIPEHVDEGYWIDSKSLKETIIGHINKLRSAF